MIFLAFVLCGCELVRDNEMGYSNKVLELIKHMYSVDHK